MSTVYIDGKAYQADASQNMLHAALTLGFDLPYFCWHPAMGSVGACRQCAVKQFRNEQDTKGRLVMACMTPATDGIRISIQDPEAVQFRAAVIEWLMVNHPHDCPVCDEGGECHLQDMTVMTGHIYRRYQFDKRTHRNQYLGPFINHEMNRCIQCYRCVRFYRDYAGGRDFDVFAMHDHVYFGRQADGVLENEFSGNLVEVCPTGVFTDKSFKQHFTRKWDLQTAPSICVHCGLGCNTIAGERYGSLRRIRNRYNHDINGYFLCDRGRYGYDFVNSPRRVKQPILRRDSKDDPQPINRQEVLRYVNDILKSGTTLVGIGSPRASLENNFALRTLVGADHFFSGISAKDAQLHETVLNVLQQGTVPSASLHDAEMADAVVVLGEDLTNTAPMLALALRQAANNQPWDSARKLRIDSWNDASMREASQDQKDPLYIATPASTHLDDVAARVIRLAPNDIARLGFALAHSIDSNAPAVSGLSAEMESLAKEIAAKLKEAQRPLIVSGTSLGDENILHASANLAWALKALGKDAKIAFTVPECNSLGLAMMNRSDLTQASKAVNESKNATLIILENDLYRRADRKFVDDLLQSAAHVIVIDSLENETTAKADMVLPAATFDESEGTLVNNESRAQRFYKVMIPSGDLLEGWRWIVEIMCQTQRELAEKWQTIDDVIQSLSDEIKIFAPLAQLAPNADFRIVGQRVPRQPHRYSGRTSMNAKVDVNEPKPPEDVDAPMSFSMEGFKGQPPSALIARYWMPGWNSVQALNKFQEEIGGPLREGDPGKRLIDADEKTSIAYYQEIPEAFAPRINEFLVLPVHHIFGSEELSRVAPAISKLIPEAYLSVNAETAQSLGVNDGEKVNISVDGVTFQLPIRLNQSLPTRVVGLPVGFPDLQVSLPAWDKLSRSNQKDA